MFMLLYTVNIARKLLLKSFVFGFSPIEWLELTINDFTYSFLFFWLLDKTTSFASIRTTVYKDIVLHTSSYTMYGDIRRQSS